MRKRKQSEGFNIAFLDIMSCGLGAVILIFLLVKQHFEESPVESELLKKDVEELQVKNDELNSTLAALAEEIENQQGKTRQLRTAIQEKQKALALSESSIEEQKKQLDDIKKEIISTPAVKETEDIVEDINQGEENYLIGLRVEGARIVILLDSSSSMTNEKLVEIIKTKVGSDQEKRNAHKWQRTVRIVRWLLARAPVNSEVAVIAYNKMAEFLGGNKLHAVNEKNILSIYSDLDELLPNGPTNLQAALQAASGLKPTNLYVVTDGLPTTGESNYSGLNPFSKCKSLLGNANRISGECRVKLFQHTVTQSTPAGSQINVVLLPIEGDPDAMYQYWAWTYTTGGIAISPAPTWP